MIKGLAITPPILGRISIGKFVERNGKRLPEKDDQFTLTTQVQNKDGWIPHPLDEVLRKDAPNRKLRSIPVRMLFNDPDLNLRAEYSLFDRSNGRPLCVGNGETCRRYSSSGAQTLPCPSPEGCDLAKGGTCKPYGRLNVRIGAEDELGTFIFRTTGFNSIRTLAARLKYFQAVSGGRLACLPLELKLRGKSTTQSHRAPIYYADLCIREGTTLESAVAEARESEERRRQAGIDQDALDGIAREGFSNGLFEDQEEDVSAVLEEFFPESSEALSGGAPVGTIPQGKTSLRNKLEQQAAKPAAA